MLFLDIKADMIQAIKNSEKQKLATLRLLVSAIEAEKSRINKEIDDELVISTVNRHLKIVNQEIKSLKKYDVDFSAQLEEREILLSYLPEQLSEDEIIKEVKKAIGLFNKGIIKNPMQYLSSELKGKADMREVSKLVKQMQ